MAHILKKLLIAATTASLAVTPIAAQAGTRAGDSAKVYTAADVEPGMARAVEGERFAGGINAMHVFLFVYVVAWTTGFIIEVTDDDSDLNQSPGG